MVGWSGWSCPLAAPALGSPKPTGAAPASAAKEETGGPVGAGVEGGVGSFMCGSAASVLGVPSVGVAVEVGAGSIGCWSAAPVLGVPAEGLGVLAEGLAAEVAMGAGVGAAGIDEGGAVAAAAAVGDGTTGIDEGGADFVAVVVTDGVATTVAAFLWAKYWMPAMAEAVTMRAAMPVMKRAGRNLGPRGRGGTNCSGAAGTGVG